jgi:uncharacterized protein (TIGR02996 family)
VVNPRARRAELLAAVIEDPDDVERRLVYADWLAEQGDPQGELIQLCERKRALGRPDRLLADRIHQLERELGPQIAGFLTKISRTYTLARGFVSTVELRPSEFFRFGERLFARHPIDRLDPVLDPDNVRLLMRAPALRKVRGLHLHRGGLHFRELCRSSAFESLRNLEIWGWMTLGDPLDDFARWQVPKLRSLTLFNVGHAPQIVAGLALNEVIRLHSLCVALVGPRHWTGAALHGPSFAELRNLRLLRVNGSGDGIEELLDTAELPQLREIALDDSYPVERFRFPELERVTLRGPIDASSFEWLLAQHPGLASLEVSEMLPAEVNRALEIALALPDEHPLRWLTLPSEGVDRRLLAQAGRRFARD